MNQLTIIAVTTETTSSNEPDATVVIESSILALDDDAFARLANTVHCGSPGFSGYNDQWGHRLMCPSYGHN